jgi:hypothetical protein
VTNSGNLTIDGVTMHVVGAGGTFTQLAGGTTMLLNGGVLDPSTIVVDGGGFGGDGDVVGDVSVRAGTVKPGDRPGGSLKVVGDYSQNGGEIVFEIDPDGAGGFLETGLVFTPGNAISVSDAKLVFDFHGGANANAFVEDGLLNLDTFFGLAGGGGFCADVNCGEVLQGMSFADSIPGLIITGFNPATGALSLQAAPEPSVWALLTTGMLALGGLRIYRRRTSGGTRGADPAATDCQS